MNAATDVSHIWLKINESRKSSGTLLLLLLMLMVHSVVPFYMKIQLQHKYQTYRFH